MWAGKAKGSSKGKGKGKQQAAAEATDGVKGHELPRVRISAEKFVGTVVGWRGKYGWIKATEDIEHEKASLRGGKLFTGTDDIIGATSLDIGAEVEFHIFEDDSGLGAEEVVQTSEGKPELAKAAGKGKSAGKANGKATGKKGAVLGVKGKTTAPTWGGGKGAGGFGKGAAGFGKGAAAIPASSAAKGKGKDKGKGGKAKRGEGHLLPRTRITAEKFTGTVVAWKGKFGWIAPSEPIEHEKATLHKGNLFVTKNDLEDIEELTPDAVVEFHIAEDSSGLCAEEVVQL